MNAGARPDGVEQVDQARGAYHHGNLHEALLRAARQLLEEDGVAGVTLRAAARGAGVSHAAPRHHFGDLAGLLSDLAAQGFDELAQQLERAIVAAGEGGRLTAIGFAYVSFAVEHPALFLLMFRGDRLNQQRPALAAALARVRGLLANQAGGASTERDGELPHSPADRGRVLRAWSIVHGFSMLLIDGRLAPVLAASPDIVWQDLLREVFNPEHPELPTEAGARAAGRPPV